MGVNYTDVMVGVILALAAFGFGVLFTLFIAVIRFIWKGPYDQE